MLLILYQKKLINENTHIYTTPGGGRKVASKDSKPRQRRKMTETERENKKRKKEQLQQRAKANLL